MKTHLDKIALQASADLSSVDVLLRQIPNDDPNETFTLSVINQLHQGKAKLCEIHANGIRVGITIYSIDDFSGHRELVSIATKCISKDVLRFDIESALVTLARKEGCKSIRMHTCRHGLISCALQNGWHTAEIVLRKSV